MRIDDSCIFAYEVKQRILSASVSSDFAHRRVVDFDVTEMVSFAISVFGY